MAIGWYEEGTRFLDVRDPAGIRQVGYWVPDQGRDLVGAVPAHRPSGEIVYALDFARGIDVLRFDRGDRRVRRAPVRRSWLRDAAGLAGHGRGAHGADPQDRVRLRLPAADAGARGRRRSRRCPGCGLPGCRPAGCS